MSETFFDVIKVILLTTVFDHVIDGYLGKAICISDQNFDSWRIFPKYMLSKSDGHGIILKFFKNEFGLEKQMALLFSLQIHSWNPIYKNVPRKTE